MVTPRTRIVVTMFEDGRPTITKFETYIPSAQELAKEQQRREDDAQRAIAHAAYLERICTESAKYKIFCERCGGVAAYGMEEEGCTIICAACCGRGQ